VRRSGPRPDPRTSIDRPRQFGRAVRQTFAFLDLDKAPDGAYWIV
jgi:hypothetical protein